MPTDPLQRFLNAQASTYEQAHTELAAGQKRSHWMWFIFREALDQRFAGRPDTATLDQLKLPPTPSI